MVVVLASARAGSGGTGVLLVFALFFAVFSFVFWAFKQRKGGAGGGAEKAWIGAAFLLAAVLVGVLMGTGGHAGAAAHAGRAGPHGSSRH